VATALRQDRQPRYGARLRSSRGVPAYKIHRKKRPCAKSAKKGAPKMTVRRDVRFLFAGPDRFPRAASPSPEQLTTNY
jgi:hypothetical protein